MSKLISLVISEENPTLPRDMETLYPGKFRTFTMKFYPGHGIRRDEVERMYKELSQIKHEVEKGDVIFYARSYGVFYKNQWEKMRRFFSKPLVIATEAIIDRLRELNAKKIYLVTPYNQRRHDYEIKWLKDMGFEVIGSVALGRTGGPAIASTPHELTLQAVNVAQQSSADAIYVACTILSTLPILEKMKGRLPVITASGAMFEIAREKELIDF
ncbi:maleate cis-trans isomerase [Stygiolobus caldivivus]|uniref:Maleate cis-trans isomerase n=1 Tax=Stygiolobus caldivivus TaxID=2824673 RepID=A0A8D5ZGL0_9CREN|nr:maleate cis-trans isomerase [Stygiolobus caldivivus]BCU71038.1 maleate cis-trans isomerase [Stygiolobus caldivivus]